MPTAVDKIPMTAHVDMDNRGDCRDLTSSVAMIGFEGNRYLLIP